MNNIPDSSPTDSKRGHALKVTVLIGTLLFAVSAPWAWRSLYQYRAVQVEASAGSFPNWLGSDRAVAQTLSDAIGKHPQAEKFRLRWIVLGNPKGPLHCEIEYDRPSGELREVSLTSGWDKRLVYANVTDDAIHKVARKGRAMIWLKDHGSQVRFEQAAPLTLMKQHISRLFGW